jgi:very-short-patch-repair endonuclease
MHFYLYRMFESNVTALCRQLRQNQTPAELRLWAELRNRHLAAYKFRRQHPIIYMSVQGRKSFFIPDFYCSKKKLIIELDGKIHEFQKDYDANGDLVLSQLGLRTLRILNEELEQNPNKVIEKIIAALEGL